MIPRCAEYISYRGSTIRFMFDLNKPQTAVTSIPFEDGWDITVNGKSVQPVRLCGGLIGLQLEKGTNSVVMTYTPPYFRTSMWISGILLVIGLYLSIKVEHEASRRRKVRMAFRAVELNISRMTVNQLDDPSDGSRTDGVENGNWQTASENAAESFESEETDK